MRNAAGIGAVALLLVGALGTIGAVWVDERSPRPGRASAVESLRGGGPTPCSEPPSGNRRPPGAGGLVEDVARFRACRAPALGVQDDHLPTVPLGRLATRLDLIRASGARVTRADVFWSRVAPTEPADPGNPADPAYRWARVDAIVAGLRSRDIAPLLSTYSAPAWATGRRRGRGGSPVNPDIPDARAFAGFMQALARRYSGSYRPAGARAPLPAVAHFELWNEPNRKLFLRPQGRALGAYVAMVRAAYPALKSVRPDATVIVGALGSGSNARRWRDALRAADVPLDAFSHHLYPRVPPLRATPIYPSWDSLPELVRALRRWRPGLRLYITEAGYSTRPTRFRPPGSAVSEREQAAYLADILAVPLVRRGEVAAVIWFNLQDNADWPTGLLRESGAPKPAFTAFADLAAARHGAGLP